MCMQYIQLIDKQLATYKTYQAIEYLQKLLEYTSSCDAYLKYQNGGIGSAVEARLLIENTHNGHFIPVTTP